MTDSPLSQLNKEEQEALAELAKGRVNGSISRRDALQAAGVLGIGSLIGGSAGIAATDSAKAAPQGTVGTSADPIANGYIDSLDAGKVTTESQTVYVDPTGDDSNDGLSASSPKATINAAISDAPLQGDQLSRLVVDIAAGTVTDTINPIDLDNTHLGSVKINGKTDASNNPTVTIDAAGAFNCLRTVGGTNVTVNNCTLTGAETNVLVSNNSSANLNNCDVIGDSNTVNNHVEVSSGGSLNMDADTTIDATGATGLTCNIQVLGTADARIDGTIIGAGGGTQAILVKQEAYVITTDTADIDANGNGLCIKLTDNSNVKIAENGTFRNASTICRAERSADFKIVDESTLTLDNITRSSIILNGSTWHDEIGTESMFSLPKTSGAPANFPPATDGSTEATCRYDTDSEAIAYRTGSATHSAGHELVANGRQSITAGTAQTLNTGAGYGSPLRVSFTHTGNSGDNSEVRAYLKNDGPNSENELVLEEVTGTADAEIDWYVIEDKIAD